MHAVVGPVVTREGGYAFGSWTPEKGLSYSYSYRRIEDAHYARKAEIKSRTKVFAGHMVAGGTVDEFTSVLAERQIVLYELAATGRPNHFYRADPAA